MDGRVDEATRLLEKGGRWLTRGLIIFAIFTVTALISALRSGPFEIQVSPIVLQISHWWVSTILSIVIGLPFSLLGLGKVRRARRILEEELVQRTSKLERSAESDRYLTDAPLSVTESTTRELERSAQSPKPQSE
jgi:hypothetical protein